MQVSEGEMQEWNQFRSSQNWFAPDMNL